MIETVDTLSADDVVRVSSAQGATYVEVRLAVDTGDDVTPVTMSEFQARKLAAALLNVAGHPAMHTTACYIANAGGRMGETFWVCVAGCPTLHAHDVPAGGSSGR